ncbi:MAG: hypothetical protein HS115_14250 [Spirochaetales bacterium]|nr:hypothetical protein [Spirochaetales bacterium]
MDNSLNQKRQQEYTEYYAARMKKYENSPMYKNSYESEKALYELMRDAKSEAEYKEKFFGEKLHLKNAIALVKDRELARLKHLLDIKEVVRARGPQRILAEVDQIGDVASLTERCNEINQANSIEISVDELTDHFYSDFVWLENYEVWETAEIPSRWKGKVKNWLKEDLKETRKLWREVDVPAAKLYDPDWRLNYELLKEDRHRRKIPVPDEALKKRIEEHKKYIGEY